MTYILFFSGKKRKSGNNVTSLNFLTFRVLQRIVWLSKANCNLRGYFPVPGGTKCWGEFYSFSILLYCRNSSLQVEFNPIKPQKRIKELKFRLVKWRTTRYSCCAMFSIKRALQWVTGWVNFLNFFALHTVDSNMHFSEHTWHIK